MATRPRASPAPRFAGDSLEAASDGTPEGSKVQGSDEAYSTSETDGEQQSPVQPARDSTEQGPAIKERAKRSVRIDALPRLLGSRPRDDVPAPAALKRQGSASSEPASAKPCGGLAAKISVRNTFVHFSDESADEEEDQGLSRRTRTTRTVPARLFLESALLSDEPDTEPVPALLVPPTPEWAGSEATEAARFDAAAAAQGPPTPSIAGEAAVAAGKAAAAAKAAAEAAEAAAAVGRRGRAAGLARATAEGLASALDAPPKAQGVAAPVPLYVRLAPPTVQARASKPRVAEPEAASGRAPKQRVRVSEAEGERTPKLRVSIRNTFLHVDEEAEAEGGEPMPGFIKRAGRRSKTGPPMMFGFDDTSETSDEAEGGRTSLEGEPSRRPVEQEPPQRPAAAAQPPFVTISSGSAALPPSMCMPVALQPGMLPQTVPGLGVLAPFLAQIPAAQAVRFAAAAAAAAAAPQATQQLEIRTAPAQPSAERPASRSPAEEGWTTVVLKNLPLNYRRSMLLRMLDAEGFAGEYDYVYLPIDFKTKAGFGYAFINLVAPSVVPRFWRAFDGYSRWMFPSAKVCRVSWSVPHQGLKAHIKRYRNSPLQHESVPDEYRPALFSAGVRVSFPPPTKELAAPSQRAKALRGGRQQAGA